jgi:hypothetical protein
MGNYGVKMQRTAGTAVSVGNITAPASSMRRVRLYEANFGSEDAPADNAFLWQLQRCTTVGTRTSFTPVILDPADAACAFTAGENHTVEPTYTAGAILLHWPMNQRASLRWIAVDRDSELVIPAVANNGIGYLTPTAPALKATVYTFARE